MCVCVFVRVCQCVRVCIYVYVCPVCVNVIVSVIVRACAFFESSEQLGAVLSI